MKRKLIISKPREEDTFPWKLVSLCLLSITLMACLLWSLSAKADEHRVSHHEIMMACFDVAIDQAKYVEFSSAEEESYAVGMMAAGCMYMQLVEQCGLWIDDSFAYPIEPDDEPGEFDHSVQ